MGQFTRGYTIIYPNKSHEIPWKSWFSPLIVGYFPSKSSPKPWVTFRDVPRLNCRSHGTSLAERLLQLFWPSWGPTIPQAIQAKHTKSGGKWSTNSGFATSELTGGYPVLLLVSHLVVYCMSMPTAVSLSGKILHTISRFADSQTVLNPSQAAMNALFLARFI